MRVAGERHRERERLGPPARWRAPDREALLEASGTVCVPLAQPGVRIAHAVAARSRCGFADWAKRRSPTDGAESQAELKRTRAEHRTRALEADLQRRAGESHARNAKPAGDGRPG